MPHEDGRRSHTVRIVTYNIHRCRGLDGRTRPSRIAAVLASINADIVALQEVVGRQPVEARAGRRTRRGARDGLGHGADAASPQRALRQRRPQPLPRHASSAARPQLEDVRAAARAARRPDHRRRRTSCTSTTCTSARRCSSAAIRRAGSRRSCTIAGLRVPRSCSAISTNGHAGSPPTCSPKSCTASICGSTCSESAPIRASFRSSISITFITKAHASRSSKVWLPKDRMAMMASDHLPLVADLTLRF